jgi:hypothetical protein
MNNVLDASAARYAWTRHLLKHDPQRWIDTLVAAILATGEKYFRWHDSLDIFSPTYCRAVIEVCRRTPQVKHWLPTRSWHLPWVDVLRQLAALPNVIVRPSALTFNDPAPVVDGLGKGTTAIDDVALLPKNHRLCPKTTAGDGASCASVGCRDCWVNRKRAAFCVHGRFGRHAVSHATDTERTKRAEACRRAVAFVPFESLAR